MVELFLRGIANLVGILAVFFAGCMVYVGLQVRKDPSMLADDMDEEDRALFGAGRDMQEYFGEVGYGVSFVIAAVCLFVGFYALFWGLGLI